MTINDPEVLEPQEPTPAKPDDKPLDTLLTMKDEDAVRRLVQDWDASYKAVRRYIESGKVNRARELGYLGARLIKAQDEQKFWVPTGATPNSGSVMNKAARLKRRVRATIFADAPIPECTPSTDTDEDRDSAEFSTRALQHVAGNAGSGYALKAGDAFDLASTWGSGYIEFWVDAQGGGWVPQEVMVWSGAEQLAGAFGADGVPVMPGPPNPDGTPGALVPLAGDPVLKFVRTDNSLTTDRADPAIKRVWRPRLMDELHTLKNVRLIPSTARDVWEADGMMIGRMIPWGSLKAELPKLASLPEDEKKQILSGRPTHSKDLIPPSRKGDEGRSDNEDETLVFCLKRYHVQSPTYPKGFYGLVLGTTYLCERSEWYDERRGRPLSLPATQFKQYQDGEAGENPNGVGVMTDLGPGNEARGMMLGTLFDHLDKFRKRKTFIPYTSNIRPEQMMADAATYLPIMPNQEPRYEQLPEFPKAVVEMYQMVSADLDDASSLQQTGQALNAGSVKSGLHAQTILEQVNVLLSEPKQNTERALVRGWQVMLELIAAKYDQPQRISWVGEDGAYKEREWTGADLGNTTDVQIHKGSFTQLAPSAKAALTQTFLQLQIIDQEDARSSVTGNIGGLMGLQDNPHRQRVRRQIGRWSDGPPPEWVPAAPEPDPQTGEPVPVPDPILGQIFAPRPPDEEPDVARIRVYELGRAIASTKFNRWPAEWQAGLVQEYERMRAAAGIQTAREAAAAQQQAAQAQQETQQAQLASKERIEAGKLAIAKSNLESEQEQAALDRALAPAEPQMVS